MAAMTEQQEQLSPIGENEEAMGEDPAVEKGEDDIDEEEIEEETGEWDEGGSSQCGYSESVHETLMSTGESVHKIVGDPSEELEGVMKEVGKWFQEASYAVRDFVRGDKEVKDDTMEAASEMQRDAIDAVSSAMSSDKENPSAPGSPVPGQ
jgi:hypothetical protein